MHPHTRYRHNASGTALFCLSSSSSSSTALGVVAPSRIYNICIRIFTIYYIYQQPTPHIITHLYATLVSRQPPRPAPATPPLSHAAVAFSAASVSTHFKFSFIFMPPHVFRIRTYHKPRQSHHARGRPAIYPHRSQTTNHGNHQPAARVAPHE